MAKGRRQIGKLDEILLGVRNPTRMRRFYRDVIGFRETFHHPGRMTGFETGGPGLVLVASKRGSRGVSLTIDCRGIERILRSLKEHGVEITEQLREGHWGALLAGFKDPEGNPIYLEEPLPRRHQHRHR